jgi:predicted Zn-ribbon and HTH transcriptional regulator
MKKNKNIMADINAEISAKADKLGLSFMMKKSSKCKCSHCGYEWKTTSAMMWVSCPSCMQKTKVVK